MKRKVISVLLSLVLILALAACNSGGTSGSAGSTGGTGSQASSQSGGESTTPASDQEDSNASEGENLDYTFGETFRSDVPVSYSMFWSDHEGYPYTANWEIFNQIEKVSNVKLDIANYMIARSDYDNKKALMINAGESAYIIPKTYDENAFVDGGSIVDVSAYFQYMPNFNAFIEKYDLQPELARMRKANGGIYRLPGLKEAAEQDYTLSIRKDYFDAAGVDIETLEKDWTWDDLYDALVKVKAYMVSQGIISESAYVWSDRWAGGGDGTGGNILKIIGSTYGVPSGWAVSDGKAYDAEKDEWYFAPISDDYKEYVAMVNKFIKGGILDPETFTQTDELATQKFYRGDTAIMSSNKSVYTEYLANLDSTLGHGNYELYITVYPMGNKPYTAENSRTESGVMIASKALKELGEDEFIKMMRFIDWLFYSDEAYDLTKWGVEGETYETVTDPESGMVVKQLLPQWYCGGLAIPQTSDDQKDMRIELGYAGGVFYYGGTVAQVSDAYSPALQDYFRRSNEYRTQKPLDPGVAGTEDETEQLTLWKTPLIDSVNTWTLQFVTGQKDVNADWDAYVSSCKSLMCDQMINLINEIYTRNKQEAN